MTHKQFKAARLVVVALVAMTVSTAVSISNFTLALFGVLIGMLFMYLVRVRFKKVVVDERVSIISGQAARTSYALTTMTLMVLSIFFITAGKQKGELYVEALGVIFGFVVLLAVALYTVSFHYLNRKYGGDR